MNSKRKYRFGRNTVTGVVEYLIWIFIILDLNTVYLYNGENHYYTWIAVGLIFVALLTKKNFRFSWNSLFFIGLYLAYMIVWSVLSSRTNISMEYISRFLVFLPACYLYVFNLQDWQEFRNFLKRLSTVVVFLALISLFYWALGSILGLIKSYTYVKCYWGQSGESYFPVKSFHNLYFETTTHYRLFGITTTRNDGIFCEGPMYATILILAIAVELFVEKKPSMKRLALFTITMITTISMTGWILMIFMYLFRYITRKENTSNGKIIKAVVGLIALVIAAFVVYFLIEVKSSTNSFLIRMDDYVAGFKSWRSSPLWGHGYENMKSITQMTSSFRKEGTSNSIMVVLSQGGIMWMFLYLFSFFAFFRIAKIKQNWNYMGFLISFIIMFCTVVFHTRMIMILLLAMSFAYLIRFNKKKKKNRKAKRWQ